MKPIKDTQKTYALSLETQKKDLLLQEKQPLLDKLHNIVTAVYLVTNLIPESETLRIQTRNSLQQSFHAVCKSLHSSDIQKQHTCFLDAYHYLYEGRSCLNILYRTSHVSDMNYQILYKEIISFEQILKGMLEQDISESHFSLDSFFDEYNDDKDYQLSVFDSEQQKTSHNEQTKIQIPVTDKKIVQKKVYKVDDPRLVPELKNVKKPSFGNLKKTIKDTIPANSQTKNIVKGKRHDIILDILKENPDISVTDICKHIDGCSSKTIQRDLNEMIDKNIVMKKGDRRWSTYSLK